MIFKGKPNLLVRITKRGHVRPLPKYFKFDYNGHYETNDPRLIKRLKAKFAIATKYKCKKCEYETFDRTDLMRHYKIHREIKE